MATIYIVRHGETEWNAAGRIQGHTDITLSDKGRLQAQQVAKRLVGVSFHAAYASDLSRASETARIILGERDAPLVTTPLLREYHKGIFEGLTNDEIERRYPQQFAGSLVKDLDFAPSGGESIRETTARLTSFVARLREHHPQGDVLVVGHGGSLRSAVVALLGLPLEANWKFVMGNCTLSIVETYADNAVLRLYNDASHLDGLR